MLEIKFDERMRIGLDRLIHLIQVHVDKQNAWSEDIEDPIDKRIFKTSQEGSMPGAMVFKLFSVRNSASIGAREKETLFDIRIGEIYVSPLYGKGDPEEYRVKVAWSNKTTRSDSPTYNREYQFMWGLCYQILSEVNGERAAKAWAQSVATTSHAAVAPTEPATMRAQAPEVVPDRDTQKSALTSASNVTRLITAENIALVGLVFVILTCIAAYLVVPQVQDAIQFFLHGATPTLTPALASPTATP